MTGAGAAWRMVAMCDALGVRVPPEEHAVMADRCADCDKGELCRLSRIEGDTEPGRAPRYCLNAETIEALALAG